MTASHVRRLASDKSLYVSCALALGRSPGDNDGTASIAGSLLGAMSERGACPVGGCPNSNYAIVIGKDLSHIFDLKTAHTEP